MKTQTQLPKFQGKPLIEIPEYIPHADFLNGEFGQAVLEEYQARVKEDYNNNSTLNILKYEDNMVKGSNPFAVCLINQIIRDQGLRTATQADLEKILKTNALNLRVVYEDSALVLRNENEPNSYLAKDLSEQIKQRQELKYPIMIPLTSLELRTDSDSNYGLAFNLKDDSEIIYAPILSKDSTYFSSEDIDENGLPKKLGEGNRYFYTIKNGLSRLYLCDVLDSYSDDGHLSGSGEHGRVVVVSAEGANENFSKHLLKLEQERERQKAEIDKKFKEAMSILRGS